MLVFCCFFAWEWINISLEYTAASWLRLPHFFLAVVAVNLLTHPLLMYLLSRIGRTFESVCVSEFVVFAAEATMLTAIYGKSLWHRVSFASFIMNATSFGTGLLIDSCVIGGK